MDEGNRRMIALKAYCCPRCHAPLRQSGEDNLNCTDASCRYHATDSFPMIGNHPALIDFERSVIQRERLVAAQGASEISRERSSLFHALRRAIKGESPITETNAERFLQELKAAAEKPVVLVVGGDTVRSGAHKLYGRDDIELRAFDVYASPLTSFIADGHQIPLPAASVDGVWIEAVLEHVLEPHVVVAEIHRVLRPGGIVYAETPFMQQVHEAAYDFTRFTHSGHRWLFRRFEEISSGSVAGPGTALIWSSRYFWHALTGSRKLAIASTLPIFWLRYFDGLARPSLALDGASGCYFLGRKSDTPLGPHDIIVYYRGGLNRRRKV